MDSLRQRFIRCEALRTMGKCNSTVLSSQKERPANQEKLSPKESSYANQEMPQDNGDNKSFIDEINKEKNNDEQITRKTKTKKTRDLDKKQVHIYL